MFKSDIENHPCDLGQAADDAVTGGRLSLLEVSALHGAMGPAERQMEFAIFSEGAQNTTYSSPQDFDDGETADLLSGKKIHVLVSTDVGSRGLDLDNVELVVMFDCPRNPTDFLHRAVRDRRPLCFCFTRLL